MKNLILKTKEKALKCWRKTKVFFNKYKPSIKKIVFISLGVIIVGVLLFYLIGSGEVENDRYCNVTGINIHGDIYTYIPTSSEGETYEGYEDAIASENVAYFLDEANNNPDIKAIMIEVDSYGGLPIAGEEIANYIKLYEKPVITFIRASGISAAYWAISSSDRIFASKNSDVGGIGATMSYLENVRKNEKEGLEYIQLSSGKFKDAGDPDKAITAEERELFMRDVKIIHENFIEAVSENRNLPIEKVREIADGSSVLGEEALRLGLIDEIGSFIEAEKYIEGKIGENASVCW